MEQTSASQIDEIIAALLTAAPEKEFTIIVVGGGEKAEPKEDLLEPDEQDDVSIEADAFMEAFYAAVFGGETRQVAGGGGGGGSGSSLDAIMQGTLTP